MRNCPPIPIIVYNENKRDNGRLADSVGNGSAFVIDKKQNAIRNPIMVCCLIGVRHEDTAGNMR